MSEILTKFANGHPPKKHILMRPIMESEHDWRTLCGIKYTKTQWVIFFDDLTTERMTKHGFYHVSCWECKKRYAAERKKYGPDSR